MTALDWIFMLLAWAGVVAGYLALSWLVDGRAVEVIFRSVEERDTTFKPLNAARPAQTPQGPTRGPCWICGQPKDGHRHD